MLSIGRLVFSVHRIDVVWGMIIFLRQLNEEENVYNPFLFFLLYPSFPEKDSLNFDLLSLKKKLRFILKIF